jgi:FkbM family methyltransferase
LAIRSNAVPWGYIASFQADEHGFVTPPGATAVGWLTRVEAEPVSEGAMLAHVSDDSQRLSGEISVHCGAREFDLLLDDPLRYEGLMLRRGGAPGVTELRVVGFSSFCLIDEDSAVLSPPPDVSLKPMRGWSRFYGEPSDDLVTRVRDLRFRRLKHPRLMSWFDRLEVLVAPREQISQALFMSGVYEPCTAWALQRILRRGDTFIDVGANVGLFTMLASRWVGADGHVVSLEPSRREFARLRHHIDHNALTNVHAFQIAAGSRDGNALLHVADTRHSGLNTIEDRFMYTDVPEAYTEVVPLVRIDDFVLRYGIPRVDVMKIDVEGAEQQVVAGARDTISRDRPALILEIAGAASQPDHTGRVNIEHKGTDSSRSMAKRRC